MTQSTAWTLRRYVPPVLILVGAVLWAFRFPDLDPWDNRLGAPLFWTGAALFFLDAAFRLRESRRAGILSERPAFERPATWMIVALIVGLLIVALALEPPE